MKIDDGMWQMKWLKKFKRSLKEDKLAYEDNGYESSGFNAVNLKYHDSITDKKKESYSKEILDNFEEIKDSNNEIVNRFLI